MSDLTQEERVHLAMLAAEEVRRAPDFGDDLEWWARLAQKLDPSMGDIADKWLKERRGGASA